ncbi:MAG TPA: SRPBCC domain-containing protein [Flavobacterium sp.]|jgi:hypothetical protein
MEKQQFSIRINASAEQVYRAMLGLDKISTYEHWTAVFNPTSSYEGSWEKGSKIYFTGSDENGQRGGMVSEIAENKPGEFVSIRHYGFLDGETEVTSGELVEKWAGGFENYSFREEQGATIVTVDIDVVDEYLEYFKEKYPKALEALKEIVEG